MASIIRIKRRAASGLVGAPSTLKNAELAYNEADDILYYGRGADGSGDAVTIPAIAGIGAFVGLSANQTITGTKTFTGTVSLSGATVDALSTSGNVTVGGNLVVQGTTTTVSSTTLEVSDKNIELGKVDTPTDTTADGGGLTLLGATNKTFQWSGSTGSWTSSEGIDLATGNAYYVGAIKVLDGTSLGVSVVDSSLESVGTITSGTWQATTIGAGYGGTGYAGGYLNGEILIGDSSGGLTKGTIAAGTGIQVTNTSGGIEIAATGVQFSAGDGLVLTNAILSVTPKSNSGIVLDGGEVSLDLSASAISGTLAIVDGGTGQTSYTDGQLLIGSSATGGLNKATLTAGSNVTITNGNGTITIAVDTVDGGTF